MKEKITDFLLEHLSFLPPEMVVVIISAMPILELRGGLPVAYGFFEFAFWKSFFLSIFGNIIPVLILLPLFRPISNWFLRFQWYKKVHTWLYNRTEKKGDKIQKYGAIALFLFTAVPIPTTGAYSACVAATFFGIRFKYAFIPILLGIIVAGATIGLLSYVIL